MKDRTNISFKRLGGKVPDIPLGGESFLFESGFQALDNIIGDFKPGSLYLIGGRPAMGKTTLILDMAINIALSTLKPVYIFSLEVSEWCIFKYLIPNILSLDISIVKSKDVNDFSKKPEIYLGRSIDAIPIFICDKIKGLYEIAETIRAEITDGIVFIDCLQDINIKRNDKFQTPNGGYTGLPLITRKELSTVLKQVAEQKHLPIVITSQLSRLIEYRADKRPSLADIQNEYIVKNADAVIFIYRERYYNKALAYNKTDDTELIVAKNNQGVLGTALVHFNHHLSWPNVRFTN